MYVLRGLSRLRLLILRLALAGASDTETKFKLEKLVYPRETTHVSSVVNEWHRSLLLTNGTVWSSDHIHLRAQERDPEQAP